MANLHFFLDDNFLLTVICDSFSPPQFSTISAGNGMANLTLQCDEGYKLELDRSPTAICQNNGSWMSNASCTGMSDTFLPELTYKLGPCLKYMVDTAVIIALSDLARAAVLTCSLSRSLQSTV